MKTKSSKKILPIGLAAIIVLSMFAATIPMASAICNNGSVNVAFVPSPNGDCGGTLPGTTNLAYNKTFTFTNESTASVNAAMLANYDTVVLVTVCDPMTEFTPSQRSDIVNWVSNGGKLIIYDSECKTDDTVGYSWLPCKAITYCPGAWGATQQGSSWVNLTIVENNTLSNNTLASPYFINTTKIAYYTDAAGDQNVFIAKDPCWCGDMIGTNVLNDTGSPAAPGTTGFSHAYHHYNKGLIIYNGLDINPLRSYSDPTADTGRGHLANIWLLELNQTWDNITGTELCGLPCDIPIVPPVIEVDVDIKPGSCPNPLNLKSKGVLPVAVLGTEDFDVTTIDPEMILLNRSCDGCVGVAPIRWSYEDVATPFDGELCDCHELEGDGYIDLTLKFSTQQLVTDLKLDEVAGQTIHLTITGNLKEGEGGTAIEGEDCIWVLETGKK